MNEGQKVSLASPKLPPADPCVIIIFGATGDLSKRSLLPALYNLACEGCLSGRFEVLCIGRQEMSEEAFRALMYDAVRNAKATQEFTEERWQTFGPKLHYLSGDMKEATTYGEVRGRLEKLSEEHEASRNHLFYLSTPPSLAPTIATGLKEAGLTASGEHWSRIVIEKPFGIDLRSAQELNALLTSIFDESQIFRIDHFLGKDTVQNILVFRFGNTLFEPIWNRNYVDYVEITAAETLGVETRAGTYEEAGALRDMIANHLLQILTLTAMEPPPTFDAASLRGEKVQVLRAMHPMTPEEVMQRTVRGQYGAGEIEGVSVPGYRAEKGVAPDSTVETFAAVEFHIENWRWAGVPFYLRSGKRLTRTMWEVAVHFKRTPQALFARTPEDHLEPNVIVLRMKPDEGVNISFGAKRPGVEMSAGTAHLDFDYQESFGIRSPAAYVTLLLDAMRGDATLFTRHDEVEAQWKLITPIQEAWAQQTSPPQFPNYASGSHGPAAADELLARNGHYWRSLSAVG